MAPVKDREEESSFVWNIRNYFEIMDEDHDPPLYLYADKLWVGDNKLFIRSAHGDKPNPDLGFKREDQKNVYSIDLEEFYNLFIGFRNMGTHEVYIERDEDSLFEVEKIDLMITSGLDKLKNLFKEDKEIFKVLNNVKEPFGIVYAFDILNKKRLKEKVLNIKAMLGNNFIVMGPIRDSEVKMFLQENQIKVIPDQFKFFDKLKNSMF